MVQNGGRSRRLSNGIIVQNGLQKGQSQPGSSRNSLVVNNGHLHPGYLPKRSSSPRLTVPVNGKSSERRYLHYFGDYPLGTFSTRAMKKIFYIRIMQLIFQ